MVNKNWLDLYPELRDKIEQQKQFVGKWIAPDDPQIKMKLAAQQDHLAFQNKMKQLEWVDTKSISELVPDPLAKANGRIVRLSEFLKELKYI